jgi:hypothetical protein
MVYKTMAQSKKLPKHVTIGPFSVELICAPHYIMYEVSEAQGAFVVKPPYKIYLDKEMIERGGADAVNVVLHECMHVAYYQYQLKDKDEETVVNSFGNFMTELLCRSELKDWLRENMSRKETPRDKRSIRKRLTKRKRNRR